MINDMSKLSDLGLVMKGSIINHGDILYNTRTKAEDGGTVDSPTQYDGYQTAKVINVIKDTPCKDRVIITIIIEYDCPPSVGDKFSTRSGCKGVISKILDEKDMPRSSDTGVVPDIIFSPLSTVTRMLVGQLCEGSIAKYCAQTGTFADGTAFMQFDDKMILDYGTQNELFNKDLKMTDNLVNIINKNVKQYKVEPNKVPLKEIFRDSQGRIIRTPIYVVPQFYQRLNKLSADTMYSNSNCRINDVTGQPVGGKSAHGGQRVGEMEKDVFCGNGVMMMLKNKMFDDSDGRINYYCRQCGISRSYNEGIFKNDEQSDLKLIIEECSNCGSGLITSMNSAHINNYTNSLIECSGITID